ncbi:hypothetical protein AVEN_222075-1 [Araneus ventricosus]|uniref:C2H2-type domain-containing protein n=1 Tax=Araneus ventricosus TaxID=182803 RepID=A0A4Y2FC78_ARAVE|nr:hypothetical protein AVEN_222075-1 [Araneus ventricosus]
MSQLLGYLTKYSGENFYCYSCLHRFTTDSLLKAHLPNCNEYNPQRIIMLEPGEDRVLEFKQQKCLQALPHEIIVIPNTMEKYISFSIRRKRENFPVTLQFVNSFQFLYTSLQKLIENLDQSKFTIMRSCMSSSQHRDLFLKK